MNWLSKINVRRELFNLSGGVIETFFHFLKHFRFSLGGNGHFRNYQKLVKFQKAFKTVAVAAES